MVEALVIALDLEAGAVEAVAEAGVAESEVRPSILLVVM